MHPTDRTYGRSRSAKLLAVTLDHADPPRKGRSTPWGWRIDEGGCLPRGPHPRDREPGRRGATLAKEWGGRGVNVNAPGYIATDNTEALRADPQRDQAILGRIPAGRWRRADDFAGATVFLASPTSDCVNGIVLPVDGGWLGR